MNIYRLERMKDDFGMLELNAPAIAEVFGDLGFEDLRESLGSVADDWPVTTGVFYELFSTDVKEIQLAPDVYVWNGCFLSLSPKAKDKLGSLLAPFGEFLTFLYRGETHYLFSCHHQVAADPKKSEELIENGDPMGIKSLAFPSESIGTCPLFKTEFDYYDHLYCTDTFKKAALSHDLVVGVSFEADLSYRRRL